VVAHPYAPLGGNYDDRVVGIVADELLKEGFVVGTFNFRYEALIEKAWDRNRYTDVLSEGLTLQRAARAGQASRNSTTTSPSQAS